MNLPQFSNGAGSDEDGKAKTTPNSFRSERCVTAETGPFPDIIKSICTKKSSCVTLNLYKKIAAKSAISSKNEDQIHTSLPIRSLLIFSPRATLTSSLEAACFSSLSRVKPNLAPVTAVE